MKLVRASKFILSVCIFTLSLNLSVYNVSAAPPISGTFVSADLGTGKTQDYTDMVNEMKATGIDTVIVPIGEVNRDCNSPSRTFTDHFYLTMPNRGEYIFIEEALKVNLKIIFGLRNSTWSPCIDATKGTPDNPNTDMGHLIAHSTSVAAQLKTYLESKGLNWDTDARIAGFYIPEEIDTFKLSKKFQGNILYFQKVSAKLVGYGKPIMISPYQSNGTTYALSKQAFENIIKNTDINIIAPQDSMGTGATTSFQADKEHFRALKDAVNAYPGKNIQAWANIETFQSVNKDSTYVAEIPGKPVQYIPASIDRIKQQVDTAKPYVTKMINWTYQYDMMSIAGATNAYAINGWNIQYTPTLAARRKTLRDNYLSTFGSPDLTVNCSKMYVFDIATKQCKATNNLYSNNQQECDSSNHVTSNTCTSNLALYPGSTTGYCYQSEAECQSISTLDVSTFYSHYNSKNLSADLNKDSVIDIFDYNLLVSYYKQ